MGAWDVFTGKTALPVSPSASAWDNPAESYREAKEKPKSLARRFMDRAKDPNMMEHFRENFHTPNQDIIKDYMVQTGATFEEAMKWAVKQDAMNDPSRLYQISPNIHPWYINSKMLQNAWDKETNKRELEKAGIKRIN